MTAAAGPGFGRVALATFTGCVVWAVHFALLYGLHGLDCARPAIDALWTRAAMGAATVAALVVLAVVIVHGMRSDPGDETAHFMARLQAGVAACAGTGVLLEGMALLIVPGCP